MTTVSKILKHIHKGKIESVYSISDNQAEIIHAKALKSSRLVNKTLADANLPEGIRVGLIKRAELIIVPNGDTTIELNDEIIIDLNESDYNGNAPDMGAFEFYEFMNGDITE